MRPEFRAVLALCFICLPLVASEETHQRAKLPTSILAHNPEGFKLAEPAIKRLGIRFEELKGVGPWEVTKSALVKIKRSVGVYRQVEGFLSFVIVEPVNSTHIRSEDLQAGDRIATEGGAFLRVIDLDLSGGGGDSCGG